MTAEVNKTDELMSDTHYNLAKRIVDNMQHNATIQLVNYPEAIKAVIVTLKGEKGTTL